jgi:hypothetical protein
MAFLRTAPRRSARLSAPRGPWRRPSAAERLRRGARGRRDPSPPRPPLPRGRPLPWTPTPPLRDRDGACQRLSGLVRAARARRRVPLLCKAFR